MEILENILCGPLHIQALGKTLWQFIPFSTYDPYVLALIVSKL